MSDHANPEDLRAFMAGIGTDADASALVAAINAKGYLITTDELADPIAEVKRRLASRDGTTMFEMQMLMNHLSQLSEMSGSPCLQRIRQYRRCPATSRNERASPT
jgi:Family of unknown function (DUF5407)